MKRIGITYWLAFLMLGTMPGWLLAQPGKGLDPKKPDKPPSLQIGSFQINNGSPMTAVRQVKLNTAVQGPVQDYRASEKPDFSGVVWKPYEPAPAFTLSEGSGKKVVFFQVRNQELGLLSAVKQDDIELRLPAPAAVSTGEKKTAAPPGAPLAAPTGTDSYKTAGAPPPKKTEPIIGRPGVLAVTGFSINNNEAETISRDVQLFSTVRGFAQEYRAGERPDLWDGDWKPYANPAAYPIRSAGYGMKTVYFQVRNPSDNQYSEIVSDTIKIVPPQALRAVDGGMVGQIESGRPFDPGIESLNLSIAGASGGNYLQLSYEAKLNPVPCPGCKVEIAIIPIYGLFVEGQENAPLERNEGDYRDLLTGIYGRSGIFRKQFSDSDVWGPSGLQTLLVRAKVILPAGLRDDNPGNNSREKRVAFNKVRHKVREEVINACKILGDGGNTGMQLDGQISLPRYYWVGPSYLELFECGTTKAGDDRIECDLQPSLPSVGKRGLSWVTRPTTNNRQVTVHWWCEAGGNPDMAPNQYGSGGQTYTSGGGSLFRFTVWTDVIGISVTN